MTSSQARVIDGGRYSLAAALNVSTFCKMSTTTSLQS